MNYVALQVKTSYSLLESLNDIKKLVSKAKDLGYTSLAITDHNNMFGVMEFYLECKKMGIKPIIGVSLDINDSSILLYAKNHDGYKNLIRLTTIVSDRNLTIDDLTYYKDNLVAIMPYCYYDEEVYNIYSDIYIGYSTIEERDKIDKKKVFINDVLYLEKEDYKYLDYVFMIRDGKTLGNYELEKYKTNFLPSLEDVLLVSNEEDIKNTQEISEMCNVTLGYTKDLLPIYDNKVDAFTHLSTLCNKGLKRRLKDNVPENYQKRLDYELDVIRKMGFCDYFLVVWDYVKYAKFNGILVGPGRGSAAGSLVSYTLGITDIDPLKYDLLFERFLNPERVTMPDIDIDFDSERREEVIKYVIDRYGEKRVAGIITFNTLGAKQVIRDVGRVMGLPNTLVDSLTKQVKEDLITSYNTNRYFREMVSNSKDLNRLYNVCLHLEGLPRHVSIHAAGIVMSRYDLDETIPLYRNQTGMYVSGYSMNYLEQLGLLKMDFLGLANLHLIDNIIKDIRENEKLNITFSNIPLDDKKTLKIFHDANTVGIFQFESRGMKAFLMKLKVSSFDDIVFALALYRPGPMDSIDTFIRRRQGKEKVDYIHPDLEKILKPTYGIIIYQEQIMQIARVLAGYSYGHADILRRAMSKKKEEVLLEERPKFTLGCLNNGYSLEIANKVYDLILKFANYGFNKSHSVGYAVIAYKLAFLKTYFYKYFACANLTNEIGSDNKTKLYINEARNYNVRVMLPDINYSTDVYKCVDKGILCPLTIIRNVGSAVTKEIVKEREKGLFTSFVDFVKRTYNSNINKNVYVSLIEAGCFDKLGYNRRTLKENLDVILNYAELSNDGSLIEILEPELEVYEEYEKNDIINLELGVFGFYLSEHPVVGYRDSSDINSRLLETHFDQIVNMVILVEKIKETTTKKNDVMAFIVGSDEFGMIDVTLFPKIYSKYNDIKAGDVIRVYGRVERRFDKFQLVVNNIVKLR